MNLLATAADYVQLVGILVGLAFWAGVALLVVRLVRAPQKQGRSTVTDAGEMRTVRVRGEAVLPGVATGSAGCWRSRETGASYPWACVGGFRDRSRARRAGNRGECTAECCRQKNGLSHVRSSL